MTRLAHSGQSNRTRECPLSGSGHRTELSPCPLRPNVWSGRALQVDFAELAVSGLASMYPASHWSVLCSGPSWISARSGYIISRSLFFGAHLVLDNQAAWAVPLVFVLASKSRP